jgi:hypothetical protein
MLADMPYQIPMAEFISLTEDVLMASSGSGDIIPTPDPGGNSGTVPVPPVEPDNPGSGSSSGTLPGSGQYPDLPMDEFN